MHTLIACWHKQDHSSERDPALTAVSMDLAILSLKGWGISIEGMNVAQIQVAYMQKKKQLDEMDSQFRDGEQDGDGIGLIRVGRDMEDRVGMWPPWLFSILGKKLNYDAVNRQFFFKHPDDKKLMRMNEWLNRIKLYPLKAFALRYPMTILRNAFRIGSLRKTLLDDTRYFQISAIDQPEKGEDGYYQFRENSFWEDSGE